VQVQNSDVSPTIFFRVLIPLIPKEICSREVRTLLKTFSTQNLRLFPQEIAWYINETTCFSTCMGYKF
jgi:hypothetical protein